MKVKAIFLIFMNLLFALNGKLIRTFIDRNVSSILICNAEENVHLIEQILNASKRENIWLNRWNCFEGPIPKISNGLIILDGIQLHVFLKILGKIEIN